MNSSAVLRWVVISAAVACLGAAEGATDSEMNVMRPASAGGAVGFVKVAALDFGALLVAPPGAGTPEAEADLAAVRQVQAAGAGREFEKPRARTNTIEPGVAARVHQLLLLLPGQPACAQMSV